MANNPFAGRRWLLYWRHHPLCLVHMAFPPGIIGLPLHRSSRWRDPSPLLVDHRQWSLPPARDGRFG